MHWNGLRRGLLVGGACLLGWAAPAAASYSLVPSPNAFSGNNVLNGVSAASPIDAWAVGTLCCSARHSGIGTLTEHWNGSAWTVVPSPDTLFNDDELNAVADRAPGDVWAVGLVKQSGFRSGGPLVLHYNGTAWSGATLPAGLAGELRSVSADGPSDVWAVGDNVNGSPLALHFNGTSWSVSSLARTAPGILQGVKAFSPSDVWAVGNVFPNPLSTTTQTIVEHWNGTAWSVVASPNPDPNSDIFHAVDGVTSSDLWAVGQQGQDEGVTGLPPGTRTLAEHWNGKAWTVLATPNANDQDTLNGVAASLPSSVAAVGTDVLFGGPIPVQRTLAERWTGTTWVPQVAANNGSTDNLLEGASTVPGGNFVWAVGFRLTAADVDQTVIERGSLG